MANGRGTIGALSFTDSFMRGFSFVDEMHSRKRREELLSDRLAEEQEDRRLRREGLQLAQDRTRRQDVIAEEERTREKTLRARTAEATRLLSNPAASEAELSQFADLPGVSQILRDRRLDRQRQRDLELLTLSEPDTDPAPTGQVDPSTQAQGLSDLVQAASVPGDELAEPEPQQPLSADELNTLAATDPNQAMALRDQQREAAPDQFQQTRLRGEPAPVDPATARRQGQRAQINNEWLAATNIQDDSGDTIRGLTPELKTAKYFDDRSNLDPEVQEAADRQLGPSIQTTIESQAEIVNNPEIDPNSRDARNARRKLSEAIGLVNEINRTYHVADRAGVNPRGFPVGNPQMTDAVLAATAEGPAPPLPENPRTRASDITTLTRMEGKTATRLNRRQLDAAYRRLKAGDITQQYYDTLLRTGQPPLALGEVMKVGKDDVLARANRDGTFSFVSVAKGSGNINSELPDEALDLFKQTASAYNTSDYPTRGTDLINTFYGMLPEIRSSAARNGFDMDNVSESAAVFRRFLAASAAKPAYDAQWFENGKLFPDFEEDFGTIADAMFNPDLDRFLESEPEDVEEEGFRGDIPRLRPAVSPDQIAAAREQFPELQDLSDQEILALAGLE